MCDNKPIFTNGTSNCSTNPSTSDLTDLIKWRPQENALLVEDVSNGKEKYGIPCYNSENGVKFNSDKKFEYNVKCRRRPEHRSFEDLCNCAPGACKPATCSCYQKSSIEIRDRRITEKSRTKLNKDPMEHILIECRKECGCKRDCQNWITQEQIQFRTEVEFFPIKGFGVRIKDFASKGQFFSEYVGEIVNEDERSNFEYQFTITPDEERDRHITSVVDARIHSNLSRFLNHSCMPCLAPFLFVRNLENGIQYPQLGFFFTADVVPGTELTIDYGDGFWTSVPYSCKCGHCLYMDSRQSSKERPSYVHKGNKVPRDEIEIYRTMATKGFDLNSRLVKEARLCDERLKLLCQGKSHDEVLRLIPSKRIKPTDKPNKRKKRYGPNDRCPSPLVPPEEVICLD